MYDVLVFSIIQNLVVKAREWIGAYWKLGWENLNNQIELLISMVEKQGKLTDEDIMVEQLPIVAITPNAPTGATLTQPTDCIAQSGTYKIKYEDGGYFLTKGTETILIEVLNSISSIDTITIGNTLNRHVSVCYLDNLYISIGQYIYEFNSTYEVTRIFYSFNKIVQMVTDGTYLYVIAKMPEYWNYGTSGEGDIVYKCLIS